MSVTAFNCASVVLSEGQMAIIASLTEHARLGITLTTGTLGDRCFFMYSIVTPAAIDIMILSELTAPLICSKTFPTIPGFTAMNIIVTGLSYGRDAFHSVSIDNILKDNQKMRQHILTTLGDLGRNLINILNT